MEDLLEKEIRGFKFRDGPGYVPRMNDYIGVIGKIRYVSSDSVSVKFPNHDTWSYPLSEIHEHLVEEAELTIEQILNNIKNLTKQI
jgi:hypothetical protein